MVDDSDKESGIDRRGRKRLLLTVVLFLVIALAIDVFLDSASDNKRIISQKLSDGRTIAVDDVTYGTNHVLNPEVGWKRWLRSRLPGPMQKLLGPAPDSKSWRTQTPQIVVWISIDNLGKGFRYKWSQVAVIADSGQHFGEFGYSTLGWTGGRRTMIPDLRSFPRRDRMFTIKGTIDDLPYSFRIENPAYDSSYPVWTPDPLPITNRFADIEVILRRAVFDSGYGIKPEFEFRRNGVLVNEEYTRHWRFSDATGNVSFFASTNEPVVRATMIFGRKAGATWAKHETYEHVIESFPEEGELQINELGTNVNGFVINRFFVGGPGYFHINTGKLVKREPLLLDGSQKVWNSRFGGKEWDDAWGSLEPWIMWDYNPSSPYGRVVTSVTDADGNSIKLPYPSGYGYVPNKLRRYGMESTWQQKKKFWEMHGKERTPNALDFHRLPFTVRVAVETDQKASFTFALTAVSANASSK